MEALSPKLLLISPLRYRANEYLLSVICIWAGEPEIGTPFKSIVSCDCRYHHTTIRQEEWAEEEWNEHNILRSPHHMEKSLVNLVKLILFCLLRCLCNPDPPPPTQPLEFLQTVKIPGEILPYSFGIQAIAFCLMFPPKHFSRASLKFQFEYSPFTRLSHANFTRISNLTLVVVVNYTLRRDSLITHLLIYSTRTTT